MSKYQIFIPAPASLMNYSIVTYPQYGACQYFFDGQIMKLLPARRIK